MQIRSRGSFVPLFRNIMTFFLLMHLRRVGRFVSEGNGGVGLRTVKVFAKNTTRRCGDFL